MSYYGCPKRGIWIGGTILFFLTTVAFVTLFLLEKFNWGGYLRKSNYNESCQAGDCTPGLTCVTDATGNGKCLCQGQTEAPVETVAPAAPAAPAAVTLY